MHHAVLLGGSYEWALTALPHVSRTEGPDVIHFKGGRMGIDEVRRLITAAYQTPLVEEQRHFVLAFDEFTHEAQNALLKLLEEPPQTAQFYIVTKSEGRLLPTLLSRIIRYAIEDTQAAGQEGRAEIEGFFEASYALRLEMIAQKALKKDDVWMIMVMNALETYAERERHVELMRSIVELRPMFFAPGASKKMILEHLALILPPKAQVR